MVSGVITCLLGIIESRASGKLTWSSVCLSWSVCPVREIEGSFTIFPMAAEEKPSAGMKQVHSLILKMVF